MIQELRVDSIEPNDYNPNVLKGEKFEALKTDVKNGNYDPVLVSPKDVFYGETTDRKERFVIIDGEWRWSAAVELGLTTIKADVREIAIFEAKTITFRKNRERGNLDPLKEAKLFDSEVQQGVTEHDIAERYGVSRSYVAGRRMLLKLSSTVIELHRKPGETLKQITRESLEESVKADADYVQRPAEVLKTQIEEEVSNVVPRGTLTPGHLKAIAVLPEDDQVKLATSVLLQDSSVRATEQASQNMLERIKLRKEFEKALEKARQKTCPHCGGEATGFAHGYDGDERLFKCDNYHRWNSMVTKAELKIQQAERETSVKTDRKEQIQKHIKNPGFIRRKETVEELTEEIRKWVLRKVEQLVEIQKIDVVGTRADGQNVNIYFPGGNTLGFGVGGKKEGGYWWNWKKRLAFTMETKDYKTVDAKTKIDLGVAASPERRAELHRFLDEIVNTNQDPFLPEKGIEELLKKYGETKETA